MQKWKNCHLFVWRLQCSFYRVIENNKAFYNILLQDKACVPVTVLHTDFPLPFLYRQVCVVNFKGLSCISRMCLGIVFLCHDAATWDPLGLVSMALWVRILRHDTLMNSDRCIPEANSVSCVSMVLCANQPSGEWWLVEGERSSNIQGINVWWDIKRLRIIFWIQMHIMCKQ